MISKLYYLWCHTNTDAENCFSIQFLKINFLCEKVFFDFDKYQLFDRLLIFSSLNESKLSQPDVIDTFREWVVYA